MTLYEKTFENNPTPYQIKNLSKHYGKFKALDEVTFTLPWGKIVGLIGKNGAGKSTLMRCMLGFLQHEGEVWLDGIIQKHGDHEIFNQVAFIPDVSGLDDRLTVKQSWDYVRALNPHFNVERGERLFARSNLPLNKKVSKLSKGMKTKLYLLMTLSLDVRYLILDEPTLGLDIAFRKEFFNTILGEFFDEQRTIFISTHQVEEVEDILQEIIFIDEGKIILNEDVEQLKERLHVVSLPADRRAELEVFRPKVIDTALGFVSAVLDSSVQIQGAIYSRPKLADIFMEYVGGSNETV
ncbi:MAG: ABC transporter ATP-binding protein [Candidatus Cloacimonetes bacterium]|nr:ABC transporter ATP-binding protein [Candidatus Cloacimonadota bacterium]MCB5286500.1 ABC transporter ATP-binding protein [Candidatus Cloacimonadota bacterium]MCK9184318.1 ABC transporter ATP-binding protein [Candidatus Cloacimonadota bacterium]MDY0228822.1 ABC transporter ATP-binding protein [Candidatus Cloacimonadaceae bacterium]